MTREEIYNLVNEVSKVFDVVRLVNVSDTKELVMNGAGQISESDHRCYATWNKEMRCENCISAKAYISKSRLSKFEFIDDEAYHVVSMYVEVEQAPYILEMVSKFSDDTLFGAYGKSEFVQTISNFNQKLYIDPLTNTYNRRYYEEQMAGLTGIDCLAMIDLDNFKTINDSFGHTTGDAVLRRAADIFLAHIRNTDSVVRYGGDEMLILFRHISPEDCEDLLEQIRMAVCKATFEDYPNLALSVSIGGFYCGGSRCNTIDEADKLLYLAKRERNKLQFSQ
ncbi:GGDEF domain-containing protein [Aminipila butyrica]|uniref:GGDEF domain-containing protein n=1 Tax=Aminipila butyrica TaxID=433296 RepID=A0A858BU89_9FIRM|nr:GGDEF domain-containing protein [Aminipila butyrica]QIB69601.1 GGDEF domain-containing protein [Aminipila butyrica]